MAIKTRRLKHDLKVPNDSAEENDRRCEYNVHECGHARTPYE